MRGSGILLLLLLLLLRLIIWLLLLLIRGFLLLFILRWLLRLCISWRPLLLLLEHDAAAIAAAANVPTKHRWWCAGCPLAAAIRVGAPVRRRRAPLKRGVSAGLQRNH